ncbi:hypothetical protein [Pedobacter aquatilis]|uniref:hypothetical protein n=1 Tax=Pedobacter aquatilis TaxID=351343 RepID=UPI0029302D22|nr:hypothetical protein [Pedobacter aquatilis]
MKSDIQQIISEMLAGGFEDDGAREAMLIQELRTIDDESTFLKICRAIAVSGSWYCVPTLMALVKPEISIAQRNAINHSLMGIRSRIHWDPEFADRLFEQSFWKISWLSRPEKLLSFITLMTNLAQNDQDEVLSDQILKEIDYADNPYSSLETLRMCTPGWDFHQDLSQVLDNAKGELAVKALVESLNVPSSLESLMNETIMHMKSDYLITRLNLGHRYKELHIGLAIAHNLNHAD